jgi:multidrug efflux pump subunit AcrA (membrane-fusion protein)
MNYHYMKHKYILLISPVAALFFSACHQSGAKSTALPPTSVYVAEAKTADAVYYDPYQGAVVALNSVELRSQVAGFITAIYFKEGDVVQKGAPLYEIDRRKYVAAYDQAVANLASAKANLVKGSERY